PAALECATATGSASASACSTALPAIQKLLAESPLGNGGQATALAVSADGGPPDAGGHGGSVPGSPPTNPTPGPAPAGAAGSAGVGGSGVATTAFLTRAGSL